MPDPKKPPRQTQFDINQFLRPPKPAATATVPQDERAELARLLSNLVEREFQECIDVLRVAVTDAARDRFTDGLVAEALKLLAAEHERQDRSIHKGRGRAAVNQTQVRGRIIGASSPSAPPGSIGANNTKAPLPPPKRAPELWAERDKNRRENPAAFTRRLYTPYFGALSLRKLGKLDPLLYRALSVWVSRHPEDAIPELTTLKDDTLAQIARLAAQLTDDERRELKRALGAWDRMMKKNR